MDRKQKEQLRVLLEARKRADKVLANRRENESKKAALSAMKAANQERMKQYARALTAHAEASGLLALAEQAAQQRGGILKKEVGYYVDYGFNTSNLQRALVAVEQGHDQGELRASHLSLRIIWGEHEAEARVHRGGRITFHNSILPVFPVLWRRFPKILEWMLERALCNPRKVKNPNL